MLRMSHAQFSELIRLLTRLPLPAGSGRLPPMMHRQMPPEGRGQRATGSGFSRAHNSEAVARAKGAGTGAGAGGKSNLAGQIIPVYGFGILLYILYILFKVKCWRRNTALLQSLNSTDICNHIPLNAKETF